MIDHTISCFDGIVWFEPDTSPDVLLDEYNHNITRPLEGEMRHVCIRHDHQVPLGGRMWLLFQSGLSLANGFPDLDEASELENAVLIEVEILSQRKVTKKQKALGIAQYGAQVRCLQIVPLTQISHEFAPCKPLYWPEENREIQTSQTSSFTFVWIISEIQQWFVLTRSEPPHLIMTSFGEWYEPFEVCNCEWDWAKWSHRVHKSRK